MDKTQKQAAGERILREPRVLDITGLSRSTRFRLARANRFPHAVRLSENAVGWRESDIVRWIKERQRA